MDDYLNKKKQKITHSGLAEHYSILQYDGSESILAANIVKNYDFGRIAQIQEITRSENSTYLITTLDGQEYIVRVYRRDKKHPKDIQRELSYVSFMYERALSVPKIHRNNRGGLFTSFNDRAYSHNWQMVVMDKIQGFEAEKYETQVIFDLAQQLAKMDNLSVEYEQEYPSNYDTVVPSNISVSSIFGNFGRMPHLNIKNLELWTFYNTLKRFSVPTENLNFGWVHSDIHTENFFVQNGPYGQVLSGIFDFDDLAYLPRSYNLGAIMWSIWNNNESENDLKLFLAVYEATLTPSRKLSSQDRNQIINFMRLRNFYFAYLEIISSGINSPEIDRYVELEDSICDLHLFSETTRSPSHLFLPDRLNYIF